MLELCCLLHYCYRMYLAASFSPKPAFIRDPKNIVLTSCIAVSLSKMFTTQAEPVQAIISLFSKHKISFVSILGLL